MLSVSFNLRHNIQRAFPPSHVLGQVRLAAPSEPHALFQYVIFPWPRTNMLGLL
jgi:hypothetical protein